MSSDLNKKKIIVEERLLGEIGAGFGSIVSRGLGLVLGSVG
ncbi:5762_t:CDS:1, partial [Scutellospora calospora]